MGPRRTDPWSRTVRALRCWPLPTAILLLSLVGGALLRMVNLSGNPPGVNQDEAVTAYDAWSIWQTGGTTTAPPSRSGCWRPSPTGRPHS